jgi:hypothetical protein
MSLYFKYIQNIKMRCVGEMKSYGCKRKCFIYLSLHFKGTVGGTLEMGIKLTVLFLS